MTAPDLRIHPPRRWSVAVDGVVWLARIADKARAFDAGMLGPYLYGQSPVDDAFLRQSRLDYPAFLAIVREAPDDAAVLAEIERRSPGATERLRGWSVRMPRRSGWFLRILDVDDGYARPWWARVGRPVGAALSVPLVLSLRAMRPLRRPHPTSGA